MYDLIIIGSGPAGLTASIYASRYKISHLVVGREPGGVITGAPKIENFPGAFGQSGVEWSQKLLEQAKSLGTEIKTGEVEKIIFAQDKKTFILNTENGEKFPAKTVIVATGMERRKLNISGEKEFLGKGVSYCATCDATFFRDKTVVVVGGNDSAAAAACHLAEFARKVFLIYRRRPLRCEPVWQERINANPKITIILETNLKEIKGDTTVKSVILDKPFNDNSEIATDGIFIEIGGIPTTGILQDLGIKFDPEGFIEVNLEMKTNEPGLFAAGDITTSSKILQQLVTACAQGAMSAHSAYRYLQIPI